MALGDAALISFILVGHILSRHCDVFFQKIRAKKGSPYGLNANLMDDFAFTRVESATNTGTDVGSVKRKKKDSRATGRFIYID